MIFWLNTASSRMKYNNPGHRGYHPWKIKHILLVGIGLCVALFMLMSMYNWYSRVSISSTYMYNICEHYDKGVIGGSMCIPLCKTRTIKLHEFLGEARGRKIFGWEKSLIKVSHIHGDADSLSYAAGPIHYAKPEKGTSMEKFQDMVQVFVEAKLGSGDHKVLLDSIMEEADANKDDKVSLAEAKTIWSLLQHNEFFMLLLFKDCDHIPHLQGFCGDNFMIERVPHTKLYEKGVSVIESLFSNYYTWGFPDWKDRVKISVGLLEFTSETYQHGTEGPFHMCGINELNVGYTKTHDVRIMDLSHVISVQELELYLRRVQCSVDSDCVIGNHCSSVCDKKSGYCNEKLNRPNIHHVCRVIQGYVSPEINPHIQVEFSNLLDRCFKLQGYTAEHQVEHSLVLNDLKMLLWKQISS